MKVTSKIQRENGHSVQLDGVDYEFRPENGYTCEVEDKAHLARFLSITEGYEPGEEDEVPDDVVALIPDPHTEVTGENQADPEPVPDVDPETPPETPPEVPTQGTEPETPPETEPKPAPVKKAATKKAATKKSTPRKRG